MKINEIRAIRGPNYYNQKPMIFMQLDLEDLEYKPTDTVWNFYDNIKKILPSLYEHTCSPGVEGGFFQRIKRGTWAGHVVEHVALELQNLIGHKVTHGKTYTLEEKGLYNLVFRYEVEEVGMRAGKMAFDIVKGLFNGELTEIEPLLKELREVEESTYFGPSTQSIVNEAKKRGIPHIRLNEHSYVQLGQGKYQRKIQATVMDTTSALGVEIAADKERTKEILSENGIAVPIGKSVRDFEGALKIVSEIGYPVVVKPLDGNHGRGISVDINGDKELKIAFELAKKISSRVIIENYVKGFDYRILVIDGKFQAAALRELAYVIGDGEKTVKELIEKINEDPNRGDGHEKILTKIKIDKETSRVLENQNFTLDSIPKNGEKTYVKYTANLSSGGTAVDITKNVHPINQRMAERISRLIGLNVIGIDIMAKTLEQPLEQGESGVVEVNAGPGFRMHLHPSEGTSRDIAVPIVDMLFPKEVNHSVPICAVTGTNGKTTTTRLISHIIGFAGNIVGMTSTDGVFVDNIEILKGDYSGPGGAEAVMKDSTVEYAVLEVARGGIIRRGLGFHSCDVGVLLNISSDHLGSGGINTLEELARLKSTVTETVKKDGYAVFNADDSLVLECIEKTKANPILFSKDINNPVLKKNHEKGNVNISIKDNAVVVQQNGGLVNIANIYEIPITFDGQASFNVENVLAAVGASIALGINEDQIKAGLLSFSSTIGQSPGRMNLIDIGDFKVLIDYGHNIGAIHATGEFIQKLMPGRKIRMAAGVGNRRTEDIIEYGKALSKYNNHVIICDPSPRNRKYGETANLVKEGLLQGGFSEDQITIELKELDATQIALSMAGPGDLVILQVECIEKVTAAVLEYKNQYLKKSHLKN